MNYVNDYIFFNNDPIEVQIIRAFGYYPEEKTLIPVYTQKNHSYLMYT